MLRVNFSINWQYLNQILWQYINFDLNHIIFKCLKFIFLFNYMLDYTI